MALRVWYRARPSRAREPGEEMKAVFWTSHELPRLSMYSSHCYHAYPCRSHRQVNHNFKRSNGSLALWLHGQGAMPWRLLALLMASDASERRSFDMRDQRQRCEDLKHPELQGVRSLANGKGYEKAVNMSSLTNMEYCNLA